MSLAERQSAERWQLTGVDLDTRRRRVLEELALKGRTEEQARFRRINRITFACNVPLYASLAGLLAVALGFAA